MIRGNNDNGEATNSSLSSSNVQQQHPEPSQLPNPRLLQPTSIHAPPQQQQQQQHVVGPAVQGSVPPPTSAHFHHAHSLNPVQTPPRGAFATLAVAQAQRQHNVTTATLQQYILSGGHVTTTPSATTTQVSSSATQPQGCPGMKPQSPFNVASSSNLARILASTQSYLHSRCGTPITAVATGTGSVLRTVTATPHTQCHVPASSALRTIPTPPAFGAEQRTPLPESICGTVHHMAETWTQPTTPSVGAAIATLGRTLPQRILFNSEDSLPSLRTPPSPHRTLPAVGATGHHEVILTASQTPVSTYHNCVISRHPQANRHKRIKLEEKPPANLQVAELRGSVLEYRRRQLRACKEAFVERLTELYFHQNHTNFVEYLQWKKRSNPALVNFLQSNALDSDDEELPTQPHQQPILNTMLSNPVLAPASSPAPQPHPPPPLAFSEVKMPTVGGTPVATSTSLPPTISQITQHGGTPLVPDVSSPPPSSSHHLPAHSPQITLPVGGSGRGIRPPPHSPASSVAIAPPGTTAPLASVGVAEVIPATPPNILKAAVRSPSVAMPSPVRLQTRQHSISAVYDSTIGSQEEIVERAKQEAHVMQRISELRKDGLWSEKRLPKVQEPQRNKTHWDYLLEEMVWLATDFAQERKWKKAAGKKCARMCQKYHQEKQMREERAEKEAELKLKRIASTIAKEIKTFWANVEKFVEFKQQSRLDLKRKKVLDLHLNFIVDQTEKYSSWLAQGMSQSAPMSVDSSAQISRASSPGKTSESGSDDNFEPTSDHSDDEETIAKEEEELDEQAQKNEVELLEKESTVPLADLLKSLPPEIFGKPASPLAVKSEDEEEMEGGVDSAQDQKGADKEFQMSSAEGSTDDEATIDEQEGAEKHVDHSQELLDLKDEGEMSLEELVAKYGGAYDSDFEMAISESSQGETSLTSESEEESEEDLSDNGEDDNEGIDIGIESLINLNKTETVAGPCSGDPSIQSQGPGREITDIAAAAESFKPKGYTYSTAHVATPVPFLLKHSLREYQHIGLDWLVTMYERKLNGILADEMGLGKTIQTIALLAHLACEKGVWGPHLIVVPTSVMLNWEMEFKKWCPAFKILTYYGSQKERKLKRQGWTKPNLFHICITSYKLVIQDHQSFRRKKWKYFILDEAQNIKNFKSQRWQLLLNFTSQRRLLLTGTPLQNSLMELWSLMHFLMPNVFQSHRDFKDWFANPVSGMIEGSHEYNKELISRLHKVLRPFLLRRLKSEVEKQLPGKYEHVVLCRLSKRQRYLYEDFMSQAKTKETLASGNFMSVINVLMQLRKVCNHPNLFEARPITSPFQMQGISYYTASSALNALHYDPFKHVNLSCLNLLLADLELTLTAFAAHRIKRFQTPKKLIEEIDRIPDPPPKCPAGKIKLHVRTTSSTAAQKASIASSLGNSLPVIVKPLTTASPAASVALGVAAVTPVKTVLNSPQLMARTLSTTPSPSTVPQSSPAVAASPLAAPTTPVASHPLSGGYTLQLVQQQPQGPVSIAQLGSSPVLSSTPITVQIQQTQQGPRFTVPTGQLAQIPAGFAQLVQTSTGQHILLTSTSQSVLQPVHNMNVGQATTAGSRMTVTLSSGASFASNVASSGMSLPRAPAAATLSLTTAAVAPVSKPVVRVAPMVVSTTAGTLTTTSVTVQSPTPTPKVVPTAVATPPMVAQDTAKPFTRANTKLDEMAPKAVDKPRKNYTQSLFYLESLVERRQRKRASCMERIARFNTRRCEACPIYGSDLITAVSIMDDTRAVGPLWRGSGYVQCLNSVKLSSHPKHYWNQTEALADLVCTPESLLRRLHDVLSRYVFAIPPVMAPSIKMYVSHPPPSLVIHEVLRESVLRTRLNHRAACLHPIITAMSTQFPDPRLIQYDCGKLQTLDKLLRQLKMQGRRVLLFTQMTRMLDVLEQFLNYHGHIYLRLDGATKIEQRQALMERFNADRRIFCFILSTRSGGIGVNLTGADTVIFYDSDWNPTMDAQAQDRCHRIGQTRDVHIYRLISERTVEENILKKANQKRLLGEVAIEGGNFTTAFFKKHTLQELFEVDFDSSKKAATPSAIESIKVEPKMSEVTATDSASEFDISTMQLEHALANAEEDTDVQAARNAKKEADLELVEFDESVPYDGDYPRDEESTKVEEELGAMIAELTPVQRYAMNFLESIQEEFSLEQLKQAEEEIEAQKKDWELGRLQVMREEEERRAQLEDNDIPYTYSREDANNQMYISHNTGEQMPTWAPPTPPQDKGDVYVDYSICFLYEPAVMPESQLPPIYVKKEHKRSRMDQGSNARKQKLRKDDTVCIPRSLFDRPTAAILKMRRDVKLHKNDVTLVRPVNAGGSYKPPTVVNKPIMDTHQDNPEWLIHEDWALLQSIQSLLELPLNLMVLSPAHIPNWDLVSDIVNTTSRQYRSPKQCKNRYESVIIPREEGKILYDTNPKKQKKSKGIYRTKNNRPMRTSQLFLQDKNQSFTSLYHQRFEIIKLLSNKRVPTIKPSLLSPATRINKHAAFLAESGINFDQPLTPMQVAANRADRIQREKAKAAAAEKQQQDQHQLALQQQQQQQLHLQQQQQQLQQQLQRQQQQQKQQQGQPTAPTHTAMQVAQQQQSPQAVIGLAAGQMTAQQLQTVIGRMTTVVASGLAGTPMATPGSVRTQRPPPTALVMHDLVGAVTPVRGISSSVGQQAVVSMPGLSPSQVQAAIGTPQQRALVASTPITSVIAGTIPSQVTTATTSGKTLTAAQLQILRTQTLYKQQRLQAAQQQAAAAAAAAQVPKVTMAVTSLLSPTVTAVQVGQAQQRVQNQAVKQAVSRTMTEAEVAQLIKRQKAAAAAAQLAQVQLPTQGQISSQILAQAQLQQLQQQQQQQQQAAAAAAAGQGSLATLVKTVSAPSSLVSSSPSVTIPVSAVGAMTGVNINVNLPQVKGGLATTKNAIVTHQQQLKLQQHILQQRKLQQQQQQQQLQQQQQQQKLAQVQAKTQLGTVQMMQQSQPNKSMPTTVTVQHIQQVIKQVQPQALHHLTQQQQQQQLQTSAAASIMTQAQAAAATSQALTHAVLASKGGGGGGGGGQATMSPTTVTAALQAAANQQALHTRVIPMTTGPNTQTSSALKQAIQVVSASPGIAHVQAPNVTVDAQGRPLSAAFAGATSIPLGIKLTAPGTIASSTASPGGTLQQRENLGPSQQQPGGK